MNNLKLLTPLKKYSEFQSEVSLGSQLPYWDFLGEEYGNCVVLSDGSLVQGLQLTGVSIETLDAEGLNRLSTLLRVFLNSLPDGADIQMRYSVSSEFSDIFQGHEKLQGDNYVIRWLSEARISNLKARGDAALLLRPIIYLFAFNRVQKTEGFIKSFFSKPSLFNQVRREEHDRRVKELSQLMDSIRNSLASLGVKSKSVSTEETWQLVYQSLNPSRSLEFLAPKLNNSHRDQEFLKEEIKKEPRLSLPSPREQLVFSDVIQTVEAFYLDGFYHRLITLKTMPEYTHSALIHRLLDLPFHFELSMQIQVPEQSKELSSLQSKRRMAHSMSMGNAGRASDLESEAKLQSTEELLRELMNSAQKVFYFQTAILLRARDKNELELKTKTILSRFRELNGAEGLVESLAGFKVYKTALPAGSTTMVRSKRVKTDNLSDFLPVYQSFEGNSQPVCIFGNRGAGLTTFDPFDNLLPNYNTLVTGSSGSGKSFLNNCILLQYLSQKPLVYIIDIGGSYKKLCEFLGGQYIEVLSSSDNSENTCINPMRLPAGETEPSPRKVKFLLALLETMFTDEDGDRLPKLDRSLLEEAILKTYSEVKSKHRVPLLRDLRNTLAESPDQSLRDFSKMLYPWTEDRPYGKFLDSPEGLELNTDVVVFDLKGLSSYPDLQAVMILILTDFILSKIDSIKDRKKIILMDECWELLKSQGASLFMEYCVRTLRKTGSGITFITQGLEEIQQSKIGSAILNNTATKFILMQRGDMAPVRQILKLNDQEMSLISGLRSVKGQFSEAFMITNEDRAVIRVIPTALEYWLATSDAKDNALIEETRKQFPDKKLPEIIHHLAHQYPYGSAEEKLL
ncbi:MAG: ATP-binding protein [Bdellovibrio sp.]|nr:ATP-binding protein [Bdellovibrio sp.]